MALRQVHAVTVLVEGFVRCDLRFVNKSIVFFYYYARKQQMHVKYKNECKNACEYKKLNKSMSTRACSRSIECQTTRAHCYQRDEATLSGSR